MSGSSREIITLQFGNYANFAGAHFWNFQDECIGNHGHGLGEADGDDDDSGGGPEIDHPALYRGGQTEHGDQTLTPRVLLFDARSSLGPLRSGGYLYNQSGYDATAEAEALKAAWGGRLQTFEAEAEPKNAFLSFLDGEGPMADAYAAVGGQDPALSLGGGAAKPPAPPSGGAYSGTAATNSQARRRGGRGADYDSEDEDYGGEEEEEGEEEHRYGGAMGGASKGEEEEKRRQAAEAALEAPLDVGEELEARAAADMDFGLDGDGARGAADVVRYWSDFLKVHLHPRSIQTLPFDSSGGDDAFNMHGAGSWGNSGGGGGGAASAGISAEQAEAAYDGFRYFLEECDNMQGTQCFVTNTDGWGGFARDMIVQIADECPNKPRLIFGLQDAGLDDGKGAPTDAGDDGGAGDGGQAAAEGGGAGGAGAAATALSGSTAPGSMAATAETQMARGKRLRRRAVNEALSLSGLSELATTYVPLSAAHWGVGSFVAAGIDTRGAKGSRYFFPHVRANSRLAYHSSAVLGAAIDTATLPFRMAPVAQRQRMAQWAHGLAPRSGMPVALLSAALPFELAAPTTAGGAMNAGRAPGEMRGAGAHGGGMANGQDLRMASTGDVAHAAGCALERKLRAATPLHEQQRALSFAEQVGGAARRQRKAPDVHAQSIVIRGLPEALKEHAGHAAGRRRGMAVARFVQRSPHAPPSAMSICAPRTALPVPLCFPRFFSPRLTRDGKLLPANVDPSPEARAAAVAADKRGCGGVSHCAAATELACTSAAGAPIRRVAGAFGSRVAMVEFEQAGAARDDLEEARVALVEMAAEYHEERSDDEDSDDAGGVGTSGALRTYG